MNNDAMNATGRKRRSTVQQAGLTLIELLVAIALGAILLSGAISLFVSNRATYELTTDMSRLQENARFALQTMVNDIRMARHNGCGNDLARVKNDTNIIGGNLADPTNGLEGFEAGAGSWSPSGNNGGITAPIGGFFANSDGITIRYLQGNSKNGADTDLVITNTVYSGGTSITVNNLTNPDNTTDPVIKTGEVAGISDCGGADVFVATSTSKTTNTVTANALSRSYAPTNNARVWKLRAVRYFVRNNAEGIPSLFQVGFAPGSATELALANQEELVDGVGSLQILYGVDANSDGVPDQFLSAGDAGLQSRNDWLSVVSVQISLLMGTVDAISQVPDDNVYQVGNLRFCRNGIVPAPNPACDIALPDDKRRRRVFQTTVSVRNS